MKRAMRRYLERFSRKVDLVAKMLYASPMSPMENRMIAWRDANGDKTLRLHYDLYQRSVVFDVGGYEGQWASDIFSMYLCTIHIFEPVPLFVEKITKRFLKNPRIFVHPFGLSNRNANTTLWLAGDGSSVFRARGEAIEIRLVSIAEFLSKNNIRHVNLLKVNIEGGEYDLLEQIIQTGFIADIADIQVQFHEFVPEAERKRNKIRELLSKTHYLTYEYEFVWENWRRKKHKNRRQ